MDLEKFFDKVNHDILIDRLSRRIEDKRVLDLIRKYLKSGIMLNGVVVSNEEGTPQGGPLSPLLSNIMLDEVDKDLERSGHKYIQTQEKAIGEFPIAQFFQKHLQIYDSTYIFVLQEFESHKTTVFLTYYHLKRAHHQCALIPYVLRP